jgi:glycosyltransferase involved in cell wall biosynthesis
MKFSLVIPCYNEAKNIPLLLKRCTVFNDRDDFEVILVDNGSTDDSAKVLKQLLHKYPSCKIVHVKENQGYGFGILAGLREAQGDVIGWTHADLQTDPQDILQAVDFFKVTPKGVFAKGKRYGRPFIDVVFTVGMSVFETLFLKKKMWDINAQPTLFPKAFFDSWIEPPHDFSLDLYAYYQAHIHKLKICRFPVRFGERAYGVSHWNVNWSSKKKFIHRTLLFSLELKERFNK